MKKVKFGVISDLHVDLMHDGTERLEAFLEDCRKEDVDFIIQLGDIMHPEILPYTEQCRPHVESGWYNVHVDKERVRQLFGGFGKPSYHVIGNHDLNTCSKEQFLQYFGCGEESYYSFDCNGFHFVVLDDNYIKEGDRYISTSVFGDKGPYISGEELAWLEKDLAGTKLPSVLFSHQRLSNECESTILNREEVRKVIDRAPAGVVMCINGHEHMDSMYRVGKTWYYNVNSAAAYWLSPDDVLFVCPERYTKEIDEKYPFIKCTAPYKESIYAIITMDEKGAYIKGKSSEIVGISPQEQGVYEHPAFKKNVKDVGNEITACIKDRYVAFES